VQLSLRRFYAEKWWERKADAYMAILESLYHMLDYFNEEVSEYFTEKNLPKETVEAHRARYQQAVDEIDKASAIGSFVIADEAINKLEEFHKARLEADRNINITILSSLDFAEVQIGLIRKCLRSILEIAQRDLGVYHAPSGRLKGISRSLNKK
jgi:hypothetical protein